MCICNIAFKYRSLGRFEKVRKTFFLTRISRDILTFQNHQDNLRLLNSDGQCKICEVLLRTMFISVGVQSLNICVYFCIDSVSQRRIIQKRLTWNIGNEERELFSVFWFRIYIKVTCQSKLNIIFLNNKITHRIINNLGFYKLYTKKKITQIFQASGTRCFFFVCLRMPGLTAPLFKKKKLSHCCDARTRFGKKHQSVPLT